MRTALLKLLGRAASLLLIVLGTSAAVHTILRFSPGAEASMPSYGGWLLGALTGDLGEAQSGEPVGGLLGQAAAESLFVVGWGVFFSIVGAVALTYVWTGRSSPRLSPVSRVLAYVLSSSPVFVLSYWLVKAMIVSSKHGFMGDTDWYAARVSLFSVKHWGAALVLGLGNGMLMEAARALDTEVKHLLESDYILFARSRGRPLWKHLGPSLVAPVTTSIINRLTAIFGGAIVVEYIFNIPGLGRLTWDAAAARDTRLLLGAATVWALSYALCNLAGDIIAASVDPRLRSASSAEAAT